MLMCRCSNQAIYTDLFTLMVIFKQLTSGGRSQWSIIKMVSRAGVPQGSSLGPYSSLFTFVTRIAL